MELGTLNFHVALRGLNNNTLLMISALNRTLFDPEYKILFHPVPLRQPTMHPPAVTAGQPFDHLQVAPIAQDHPNIRLTVRIMTKTTEECSEIFPVLSTIPRPLRIGRRVLPVIRRIDGNNIEGAAVDPVNKVGVKDLEIGAIQPAIDFQAFNSKRADIRGRHPGAPSRRIKRDQPAAGP